MLMAFLNLQWSFNLSQVSCLIKIPHWGFYGHLCYSVPITGSLSCPQLSQLAGNHCLLLQTAHLLASVAPLRQLGHSLFQSSRFLSLWVGTPPLFSLPPLPP